jgi:RNA polymerase sigma-70 factor (ECF subfamily)
MKVRQALSADQRALLESLLEAVGPRLLAYVRKAFGNSLDAEEIVAETFARAADNIVALACSKRKDLYLLTVARNLCRDAFRRRRPDLLTDEQLRDQPATAAAPHERSMAAEDRQRLLDAVSRLPQAQREVVVLRMSAELKFEEIAELLGIPLGTALSRMNAALRQLRKELDHAHAPREA